MKGIIEKVDPFTLGDKNAYNVRLKGSDKHYICFEDDYAIVFKDKSVGDQIEFSETPPKEGKKNWILRRMKGESSTFQGKGGFRGKSDHEIDVTAKTMIASYVKDMCNKLMELNEAYRDGETIKNLFIMLYREILGEVLKKEEKP